MLEHYINLTLKTVFVENMALGRESVGFWPLRDWRQFARSSDTTIYLPDSVDWALRSLSQG